MNLMIVAVDNDKLTVSSLWKVRIIPSNESFRVARNHAQEDSVVDAGEQTDAAFVEVYHVSALAASIHSDAGPSQAW